MIKIFFSLILAAAGPACAFDLPAMNAARVKEVVAVPAAPAAVKAASQSVWMSVTSNPGFKEARANDWNNHIEAEVRGAGNGRFDVNLRTDQGYSWASINKNGSSYNIFGAGLNLYMSGGNSYYNVSGSYLENGKNVFVNVSLSGSGANFNIYGQGLNLFASSGSINGWYDPELLPKKALAAVTAFILTLQVEAA